MKIIISPAKKLKTNCDFNKSNKSTINFNKEAKYLIDELRKYSVDKIKSTMNLSDSLAKLNYERYKNWSLSSNHVNHAIYMFQGDVYKGININKFSNDNLFFAQENLKIISGLYGILRPLDLIYPYRLEMGTKIKTLMGNNLYDFWGDKLHNNLVENMSKDDILINLASNEYSKAVKLKKFKQLVITPIFKDYKNGKLKIISFYAKRARGEMVSYIIKNKINNIDDLKLFSNDGYKFQNDEENNLVFVR